MIRGVRGGYLSLGNGIGSLRYTAPDYAVATNGEIVKTIKCWSCYQVSMVFNSSMRTWLSAFHYGWAISRYGNRCTFRRYFASMDTEEEAERMADALDGHEFMSDGWYMALALNSDELVDKFVRARSPRSKKAKTS